MHSVIASLALCLAASEAGALAAPWFLSSCPKDSLQKAAKTGDSVRKARPGDPDYVVHPYPTTAKLVFADFVSQFQDSWSRQAAQDIPAPERSLLAGLAAGKVRYEVLEVAEWRAQRCSRIFGKKDLVFLLRLFDKANGNELARITLQDSGLLATLDFAPEDGGEIQLTDGHRLEPLERALAAARQAGIKASHVQYVAVGSPSLACYDSIPCIALRQGTRAFLYRSGQLFELEYQKTRISNEKLIRNTPERAAVAKSLGPHRHVVSLGGDDMTIARPVAGPER
jgi:hypothetical protein